MSAYTIWRDAVHALGGRTTTFPFRQTATGAGNVYGAAAAAFTLTVGSDLVARNVLPAEADGVSADHRTWYYLAPAEVIAEAEHLADATQVEGQRAGAMVLSQWQQAARDALGAIPSGLGALAGFVPWWIWAAGGLALAYQLGFLKRRGT